jgi:hypothetical protein
MRTAVLACLLATAIPLASAGAAEEGPLPPAVDTALARYVDAVAAADKEAQGKKLKAQAEALRALDRAQQDATKAGNLDLALRIRAKRDAIAQEQQSDLLTATAEPTAPATAADWDRLQGRTVKVLATQPLELGDLPPNVAVRFVPNPADTWQGGSGQPAVGYTGIAGSLSLNLLPQMAMLLAIGGKDQVVNPLTVHQGEGKATLRCNDLLPGDNIGAIRVKIVPVAKP